MNTIRTLVASMMALVVSNTYTLADAGGNHNGFGLGSHMHYSDMHGYWMMPLAMVTFVIVTVAAVILVIRWVGSDRSSSGTVKKAENAADILRERFARGDIDENEYRERLSVLSQ